MGYPTLSGWKALGKEGFDNLEMNKASQISLILWDLVEFL